MHWTCPEKSRDQITKTELKGKKLSDGKPLSGKGRLTDKLIDQLTIYYGNAIRSNTNSLESMRKAVWAHTSSYQLYLPVNTFSIYGSVDAPCIAIQGMKEGAMYSEHKTSYCNKDDECFHFFISTHFENKDTLPRRPLALIKRGFHDRTNLSGYLQIDYCINPVSRDLSLIVFATTDNESIKTYFVCDKDDGIQLLRKNHYLPNHCSVDCVFVHPDANLKMKMDNFLNVYTQRNKTASEAVKLSIIFYD